MAETSLVFNILARDKASSTFDKLKGKAALLGAAIAVMAVKFGKDGVSAASDLEESLNKSNVIFGKNAASIEKWAGSAARNFGLSKQAAIESVAGFGNMFDQLGFTGDQATKMSKKVVTLSADLGSFNNLPTAQVTDMMSAAFRGEYDSLQRLIPNINAARVQQEALTMTGKTSVSTLTAQEKAAATLAIVQRDGAAANGDFARTSGSLANQQKILSATYQDVAASAGKALLPAITALSQRILGLIGFIKENKDVIVPMVAILGTFGAAVWAVNAATKAYTAVQAALNVVLTANPIGLVIAAIAALVIGLVVLYNKSETFRTIVNAAFREVAASGQHLWEILKDAFRFITNAWLNVAGAIIDGAVKAFGWIPGIGDKLRSAQDKFHAFKDSVNAALGQIQDKSVTITARVVQIGEGTLANKRIPLFAGGVQNFGGGWAEVGERGRELVYLPPGSDVYSNADSRQMMGSPRPVGGGSYSPTYNIYESGDPNRTVAKIQEYERRNGTGWRS